MSVKGNPRAKLSPLHQRVLFLVFLVGLTSGSQLAMDNLYNSVDFSHLLETGETFELDFPPGWIVDLLVEMQLAEEGERKVEWTSPVGIHTIGTLRGNRGSEKTYQGAAKLTKAEEEELRAKPYVPDRVKVRVTNDDAQVMTTSIFDKKWFQMIDTCHTEVSVEQKERDVFDRARGRRGKKKVDITNVQNLYNNIMGYVDLDDLLAWFYRWAPSLFPLARARCLRLCALREPYRCLAAHYRSVRLRSVSVRSVCARPAGATRSASSSFGGRSTSGPRASSPTSRTRPTSSTSAPTSPSSRRSWQRRGWRRRARRSLRRRRRT